MSVEYDKTKFFWFQLKEDFFDDDAISWLEEQTNGKEYCLFYIKLCLKSLKTNGLLVRQVGTVFIPYTYEKISEITKTDIDTVAVALELFMKIGLVNRLDKGKFFLPNVENLIGSKSAGAFKKQQQRLLKQGGGHLSTQREDICPPELELNININKNISRACAYAREPTIPSELTSLGNNELPPTIEEIEQFCKERASPVNAKRFYDYYSSNDWRDSSKKSILSIWKQRLICWEKDEPLLKNKKVEFSESENKFYGERNGIL